MMGGAENQMIVDADVQLRRRASELVRDSNIVGAWRRVAGRMIVRQKQPGCAEPKSVRKNLANGHGNVIDSTRIFDHPQNRL